MIPVFRTQSKRILKFPIIQSKTNLVFMYKNSHLYVAFSIIITIILFSCRTDKQSETLPIYKITKTMVDDSAMVVTAHPVASQAGYDIMKQGGNAVDAAVSVQFALAVCYPIAGNIGGGGFMVYRGADGSTNTLDYREMAPAAAYDDMYLDENGDPIAEKSQNGGLSVGVPGTVAGMYAAFEKYSKLKDWKMLLAPAILAAEEGFKLTDRQAMLMNKNKANFDKYNNEPIVFTSKAWKRGDLLIQPKLASTLKLIAEKGPSGFYQGIVADQIVTQMKKSGGIITHEDLKTYSAKWREPITFNYRGNKIISMPPPSSGGIALAQIFGMVEAYNLKDLKYHSKDHLHLVAEAERRAYADRATHLGDSDFYNVPISGLIDRGYLKNRMSDFDLAKATVSENTKAGDAKESLETTHYSIVDVEGNAVSMTTTLNGGYGSKLVVAEAGFLLNNEMDDFSAKPGTPNMFGLVGAEANKIEPGKRMLSSMTPTIVEKDGKLLLICGTPGGSTIITSVFQTVSNVIDFDMTATEAVQSPRFHHQWLPDALILEDVGFDTLLVNELNEMGHHAKLRGKLGKVEAIKILENGNIEGAADTRADDDVKGF
ncbi:MAG: gamma-glutamyltranspeptidase/glutathione hydrolase [Saprospiraceae bacterium]|jgi:gamma-glutamyltranspeptidase/glutathione hydrolase